MIPFCGWFEKKSSCCLCDLLKWIAGFIMTPILLALWITSIAIGIATMIFVLPVFLYKNFLKLKSLINNKTRNEFISQ